MTDHICGPTKPERHPRKQEEVTSPREVASLGLQAVACVIAALVVDSTAASVTFALAALIDCLVLALLVAMPVVRWAIETRYPLSNEEADR